MGTVELALIVDGIRCHHLVKPKMETGSGVALVNTVRGVVAPGTVHNRLAAHASARKAVISGSALLSINKSLFARSKRMGRRVPSRYQVGVGRGLRIGEHRSGHASHADIAVISREPKSKRPL